MTKPFTIALFLTYSTLSIGKYTYFNHTIGENRDLESEKTEGIEYYDGNYYSWGVGNSNDTTFYHITKFDEEGQLIDEFRFQLPFEFLFVGVTNTFQKAIGEEAFYVMGTKVDTISVKGYVMKIFSDLVKFKNEALIQLFQYQV